MSRQAAIDHLRTQVAWREPYIFIRTDCGGGTAWGCSTEAVWRVGDKSCRLIGVFIVTDESENAGVALRGGQFHDWYDKLENADFPLAHVQMPGFETILAEGAGSIRPDLDATWRLNQEAFQQALATVTRFTPERVSSEAERREGSLAAFAKALTIAKYCGKTTAVSDLEAQARAALSPGDVEALDRLVGSVVTGEVLAQRRLKESCVA